MLEKVVEKYVRYTRQQAIDYVRNHYKKFSDRSDDECWHYLADDEDMLDAEGNIYSTQNPQSKWDWYVVGGRWSDSLKVGTERLDSAKIKDIDFSDDMDVYEEALRFWDSCVDHKEASDGKRRISLYTEDYYREYYGNRETYAHQQAQFSTYAVITPDGIWHAPGEMGWFGVSSEDKEEFRDWYDHYKERFIDASDGEWTLTVVDCHI